MNKIKINIFNYTLLFIFILIFMYIYLGISNVDLYNPPIYTGDSVIYKGDVIFSYAVLKSVLTEGTPIFGIPFGTHLGAPGTFSMGDFPCFDGNLSTIIIKIIYGFSKNVSVAIYLYYFLTFFLVGFSSFYVFKKFRINTPISMSMALLFTFAPYHVQRNMWHMGYASYYLVPFMLLVVFWIWSKKPLFFKYSNKKWHLDLLNKKSVIALLTILLSGIFNIYFDYYWMFFLTVAAISAWYYRKNIYNIYSYLITVALNFFVVILNASPYIIYKMQNGPNLEVGKRLFTQTEIFSLKIVQMILPVDGHFLFGKWKEFYNANAILVNENTSVTLGIIALTGFIFILFYFLFVRNKTFNIFNKCGLLTISGLLFGTIGGLSTFISLTLISEFRSNNRISIFISFLCILVFAILLQKWLKRIKNKRIIMLLIVMITTIGIRDELPLWAVYKEKDVKQQKEYYAQLKDYMSYIESINKENAMIYQLPYISFPEVNYELFNPYLVSNKLRFSFGAMRGREAANWNKETSELEPSQMIDRLREKGFSGILINKNFYQAEQAQSLIKEFDRYFKYRVENDEYVYYQL